MQVPRKILACVFVLLVQSSLNADEESLRRFLAEAPAAWQGAMRLNDGKEFAREKTRQDEFNGLSIANYRSFETVHWFGDSARIEGVFSSDKANRGAKTISESLKDRVKTTEDYAAILNSDYYARLGVKPTATLSQILPVGSPRFMDSRMAIFVDAFPSLTLGDTFMPHAIVDLPEFIDCEFAFGYQVKDVERISDEGKREVMRVTLEAHSFGGKPMSEAFRNGFLSYVDLVPSQRWVVQAFHQEYVYEDGSGKFVVDQSCEYNGPDSHPKLVQFKSSSKTKNAQSDVSVREIKFFPLTDSNYSKSDCRLASFGLPEPKARAPRNIYSWVAIMLVLLVAGALIYKWKKGGAT